MPGQSSYRVVVVGAGFGGIGMAVALQQAGIEEFLGSLIRGLRDGQRLALADEVRRADRSEETERVPQLVVGAGGPSGLASS